MPGKILHGSRALITGATAGIGRATASLFAASGCNLLLIARRKELLQAFATQLHNEHDIEVLPLCADVSNVAALKEALGITLERYPIDIAILNAGIGLYGPFSVTAWQEVEKVLRTNIDGTLGVTRMVIPQMLARRKGSVVFVSSVLGKRAIPWNTVYCATKQALHGFADGLRLEVRRHGIHVGIVAPARTSTDFFKSRAYAVPQTKQRKVSECSPDIVARAILKNVLGKRRETVVTFGGMLYCFFGYHFPRTCDFMFSRLLPSPEYNDHTDTSAPYSF
jgi:short-subunit dehydrogenase